ncbi:MULTISPECIES: VWA domain-containing protein [Thermomonospora]|uniref:von Willebrand factor type A n=1 Tax=Thermomonospora curvata (strain ATCC 19995 / DSM 43183 / JCM 3096 / KCTC 9072 / NBRC 15933 / NCIMB 10081 / Henssen B9) TaxID=471852 RepID=D1A7Q0_THECD|nr:MULTISPECIES: VWA domain-containing protein [Thermomonospora]ACY96639.1 von Willebrand factor type A [Thermomonospora curvata DSM 43183]PKK15525.1 MAG: VWA domain-containing protein [Thermomonospora sp. CIF 1]
MSRYRYGAYQGGPDPLEPPYDIRSALDAMGDSVLEGSSPGEALRALLRRGLPGGRDRRARRGLDELLRQVRQRRRELRERGRLDGVLEQARALLDTAIGQERAELFPDPSDEARMREAELDALPSDTAQAIRRLSDYDWRSPAARATFEQLKDLLRRDVLDAQFQGMRQALANPDPQAMQRVRDMMAALNDMLDADARGEHTQEDFANFMREYGDFFPDNPRNLEELVDSLARRAAAMDRLLASLSPEQRQELAALMAQVMEDAGLAMEMTRLGEALRARRPDLGWGTPERMSGSDPLSVSDATAALAELADLAELEAALAQDYPGASLDDIDEEAVRRALGRQAVDDLAELRRIEKELERQGYLQRSGGRLELTPKAVRRLGETALRRVFSHLEGGRRGDHDQRDAGQAGELTGSSRPWRFGDEQPLDVVRTVGNAIRRNAQNPTGDRSVKLSVDDFEVLETERRTAAAVCLLVDLSYSMVLRGAWGAAKQTALALHSLVTGKYPQDAIQIIGFSNYARVLRPTEMAALDWDMVQGTNLHHALMLAGRHLDRHPDFEPIVLVVTDGEPTAHLQPNGRSLFDYPPSRQTLTLTLAEIDKMTRRGATLNVFMLADDPRLVSFVEEVARRNGGRVFAPEAGRLGEYVVSDYLRMRRG